MFIVNRHFFPLRPFHFKIPSIFCLKARDLAGDDHIHAARFHPIELLGNANRELDVTRVSLVLLPRLRNLISRRIKGENSPEMRKEKLRALAAAASYVHQTIPFSL